MQRLWSPEQRTKLWRELWLALAEEQRRLGLDIPIQAVEEMKANLDNVDLDKVREYEERFRHDVMAHIHAFGDQAPAARPFIHLGATSCYVTDNTDLILIRKALQLILGRLSSIIEALSTFALEHRALPTVAYTHFQPAQLTTVGKRATLWMQDFCLDAAAILQATAALPFRGCKGTTGTQASYLELFHGDHSKVIELDRAVARRFDFGAPLPVTGQTYTRKLDSQVLDSLSGVAQSAAKFATDLRLLQHEGEVHEPVEAEQVGSSAMAYKRNPMRAERICALARHVITLSANAANTAATQWLERTLDDSANRRLRVMPFMATERWLMLGVEAGGDRQTLHEVVRRHSRAVQDAMAEGSENDLLDRLAADPAFSAVDVSALQAELEPRLYIGRSPEQVTDYIEGTVTHLVKSLAPYKTTDEDTVRV
jgi:adenylosuccinate lyase